MTRANAHRMLALSAALVLLGGCASKKYVRGEVAAAETRTAEEIADVTTRMEASETRIELQEEELAKLSTTAREALERAVAAGKLAEGKFLYETVLADDQVKFGFDKADLSDEARLAMDDFAAGIKLTDENVYIEIQGHTDSTGSDEYNIDLGEARAEAVRRYLSREHGFALHRMSLISYGESEPVADNSTRDGRAKNRRVVLVVLR